MEKKKIFTKEVWDDVKAKKNFTDSQMSEYFEKGFQDEDNIKTFICKICKKDVKYENRSRFVKGCCFECTGNKGGKFYNDYFELKKQREKAKHSTQFGVKLEK